MTDRDNSLDPTPYAVICKKDGLVFLDEDDYLAQLSNPDVAWRCPKCSGRAEWDDDCQETNPADEA